MCPWRQRAQDDHRRDREGDDAEARWSTRSYSRSPGRTDFASPKTWLARSHAGRRQPLVRGPRALRVGWKFQERLALKWSDGISRLLRGIRRPLLMVAATGSADRSRLLDRRRKEGEAAWQPYRRSFCPPCVPTLHAADRRHRISLAD